MPIATSYSLANISIADLNNQNGFILKGIMKNNEIGFSVSSAGDINGDGLHDIMIGAPYVAIRGKASVGQVYVIFGAKIWSNNLELLNLDGKNGFILNGTSTNDQAGFSISDAGDINGDGVDDFIIGAPYADVEGKINAGQGYIIFGKGETWPPVLELSTLNGENGFIVNGINAYEQVGYSVSKAGDVNGDGLDDVIIGAPGDYSDGKVGSGESYVIFGKQGRWNVTLNATDLNGKNGFVLYGVNVNDYSGSSVSGAGDVNGDGLDDLIIGSPGAAPNGKAYAGQSYVVFGRKKWNATVELSILDGLNGFILNGIASYDDSGRYVKIIEDINGDNISEILISAPQANHYGGQNYVIFGRREKWNATFEFTNLNGQNGFIINGVSLFQIPFANPQLGGRVSGVGDVNGDGLDDIIIGVPYTNFGDGINAGQSYVIFGKMTGWNSTINLNDQHGLTLYSAMDHSNMGFSVSGLGDINGDGADDFIIGAPTAYDQANKKYAGQSYVIFGENKNFSLLINQLNIASDGMVVFDSNNLLIDPSVGTVLFSIDQLRHGQFEQITAPGIPIMNFTQQELTNKQIIFYHDGSIIAPSYRISCLNRLAMIGPQLAIVHFTHINTTIPFVASYEISTLINGINGFALNGMMTNDFTGFSVSGIGDVNGDGLDDVVVGSPYVDINGETDVGRIYVVFGKNIWNENLEFSDLNGENGVVLNGVSANDQVGFSVNAAGDINGDGVDDFIIGTPYVDVDGKVNVGQSYIIFGKNETWPLILELSTLNGENGFIVNGINAYEQVGYSVSKAGDVNGDGVADVIIGVPGSYSNGRTGSGASYVIFGKQGRWNITLNATDLNGENGFVLYGVNVNDYSGSSVSGAGDVNGDGLDDLIIGSPGAMPNGKASAGQSYVVFGREKWNATFELSALDGFNGFILNGIASYDDSGRHVKIIGDINGDKISEILISAPKANDQVGQGYVIFGKKEEWHAVVELKNLDGKNGFALNGIEENNYNGYAIASAGDVNGDGLNDIILSTPVASPDEKINAGQSYVILGKIGEWNATFKLSDLNGKNGFALSGIDENDYSGFSVASAGDINGDGIDDLITGAPGGNNGLGQSYVIFGGQSFFIQFAKNELTVKGGQSALITDQQLSVRSFSVPREQVQFSITDVQHGKFALANNLTIPITKFTQVQIDNHQVYFVHDGSQDKPAYFISAGSPNVPTSPKAAASIYFTPDGDSTASTTTLIAATVAAGGVFLIGLFLFLMNKRNKNNLHQYIEQASENNENLKKISEAMFEIMKIKGFFNYVNQEYVNEYVDAIKEIMKELEALNFPADLETMRTDKKKEIFLEEFSRQIKSAFPASQQSSMPFFKSKITPRHIKDKANYIAMAIKNVMDQIDSRFIDSNESALPQIIPQIPHQSAFYRELRARGGGSRVGMPGIDDSLGADSNNLSEVNSGLTASSTV